MILMRRKRWTECVLYREAACLSAAQEIDGDNLYLSCYSKQVKSLYFALFESYLVVVFVFRTQR